MAPPKGKSQKNLRLSPEAQRLLALLANSAGIGESAVVEIIVREKARSKGFIGGDELTLPTKGGKTHKH